MGVAATAETAVMVGDQVGNQVEALMAMEEEARGAAERVEEAALAAGSAAQMAAGPEGTRELAVVDMAPEREGSAAVGARAQD